MTTYTVGVDTGGTECRAVIADSAGIIVGRAACEPAVIRYGAKRMAETITHSVQGAAEDAGVPLDALSRSTIVVGAPDMDRAPARHRLKAALEQQSIGTIHLSSDSDIAHTACHGDEMGGTVVLRVVSSAVARLGWNKVKLGGYGFPVSGMGGGAHIGLGAVKLTLMAQDGLIPASPMTRQIMDRFEGKLSQLHTWRDRASAMDYALLAAYATEAADKGDQAAVGLLKEAAGHTEQLLSALVVRGAQRLCVVGEFADAVSGYLRPEWRDRLSQPYTDILSGALVLAKEAA